MNASAPPGRRAAYLDIALALAAALVAVAFAATMFVGYARHPDGLWRDLYHDRNAHLAVGMTFALALRSGDIVRFLSQLQAMAVWGPVNGLVMALVMLVGGVDHQLAVAPGLIGFSATCVFVWLIARRLTSDRLLGCVAGAAAMTLTIASPAFRLLCTDAMLEGLGSGLSAAALWAYLAARAEPAAAWRWRVLALILTALFFDKYNYWGLAVLALGVVTIAGQWRDLRAAAGSLLRAGGWRWWTDPLFLAAVIVGGAVLAIDLHGPAAVRLFGRDVSLYPADNLLTAAYALAFARAVQLWRRHRAALGLWLGVGGRVLLAWSVLPAAISFLVPHRLSSFLWYVGPADRAGAGPVDPIGGAALVWRSFADGFSAAPWLGALAILLALVGATQVRRLPPGGVAVFVFTLVSIVGVTLHPNHQSRFLASWIFGLWICAGIGMAAILGWLVPRGWTAARALAGAALAAGLAAACAVQAPSPVLDEIAIRTTTGPSNLDYVRPWADSLGAVRRLGVVTTFGRSDLFIWALEERCQCPLDVEFADAFPPASHEAARATTAAAIAGSRDDAWAAIDATTPPPGAAGLGFDLAQTQGAMDALAAQTRFRLSATHALPTEGATASIWRRVTP